MDKLKRQFLRLQEHFASKKPSIKKFLDRWSSRGKTSLYKQAKLLFDEAEQCEREIINVFEDSDWKQNKAFLKVKLKSLDGLLQELESIVEITWLKLLKTVVAVLVIVFILRNFFFGVYHVPTSSAETSILVGDRVWGNKLVYVFKDPKPGDIVMFEDPLFKYSKGNFFQRLWQKYIGVEVKFLGFKRGPKHMAKRVVASPGDVIEGKVEDGKPVVYLNGKVLNEPYVNKYPLIAMKKTVGFFESEKIGRLTVPDFLRTHKKTVLYSYDPKKDFEDQPFYFIDYKNILYDKRTGYMKAYKSGIPSTSKDGKIIDVYGPLIIPAGKYWVMGDNRRNSIDSREWGLLDRKKISGRASFIIWSLDSEEPIWIFDLIKNPFRFISRLRLSRFFKTIEIVK